MWWFASCLVSSWLAGWVTPSWQCTLGKVGWAGGHQVKNHLLAPQTGQTGTSKLKSQTYPPTEAYRTSNLLRVQIETNNAQYLKSPTILILMLWLLSAKYSLSALWMLTDCWLTADWLLTDCWLIASRFEPERQRFTYLHKLELNKLTDTGAKIEA